MRPLHAPACEPLWPPRAIGIRPQQPSMLVRAIDLSRSSSPSAIPAALAADLLLLPGVFLIGQSAVGGSPVSGGSARKTGPLLAHASQLLSVFSKTKLGVPVLRLDGHGRFMMSGSTL